MQLWVTFGLFWAHFHNGSQNTTQFFIYLLSCFEWSTSGSQTAQEQVVICWEINGMFATVQQKSSVLLPVTELFCFFPNILVTKLAQVLFLLSSRVEITFIDTDASNKWWAKVFICPRRLPLLCHAHPAWGSALMQHRAEDFTSLACRVWSY